MPEEPQGQTITAVERAADVLSLFADLPKQTLGVTEIARELGLSKAVVHRILASYRTREYVELDEGTHRYRLGRRSLELGLTYLDRVDVHALAREVLPRLVEATGETATVSLRSGATRVYVDQLTPSRDIRMVVQLGRPFPLHAGASSKAFLAFLPERERAEYLAGDLQSLTEATMTNRAQLDSELAVTRRRGYAVSRGERQVGAASVAAPVFDHHGVPAAVLSVCGPVERFSERVEEAATHLLSVTSDLSGRLGHRRGPSEPAGGGRDGAYRG